MEKKYNKEMMEKRNNGAGGEYIYTPHGNGELSPTWATMYLLVSVVGN
jgi:hypothetical protein